VRSKGKGKGLKKGNKFKKLLKLLNIYIGLYLTDNTREYIIVINSNILAGELKYSY